MFTTAASAGIRRLFHYQRFDAKRFATTVSDNTIYFSDPRSFNDPWDCKPLFIVDSLDDPGELERYVQWYIDISRRHHTGISEAQIQVTAARYRADPALFRAKIKEFSQTMAATIGDEYRVYCLSAKPDSELMWSHYTESHKGLCLEFCTRNAVFATAYQVAYSKAYPVFDVTSSDTESNLLPLLAKSASWAYEEEYRLISQEAATARNHETIISNQGIAPIPADALTSIIVGCLVSDETIATILSIIAASGKPIQLQKAVRSPNQYVLNIETLT